MSTPPAMDLRGLVRIAISKSSVAALGAIHPKFFVPPIGIDIALTVTTTDLAFVSREPYRASDRGFTLSSQDPFDLLTRAD